MKNIYILLLFLLPLYSFTQIIYVDSSAVSGQNTGLDWGNAFTDLQVALSATPQGNEIWVAKGTYYPTDDTNREIYFHLPSNVALIGGFAGGETNSDQRDWELNKAILSGDIGISGDSTDNSYTVMYAVDTGSNTRLDGFTVEWGTANSSVPLDGASGLKKSGGGFYLKGENGPTLMTINNCIFRNNFATYYGGGIYLISGYLGSVNASFDNCKFYNNSAFFGGGIGKYGGGDGAYENKINNCNFSNNTAIYSGGAFYILNTYGTNPFKISNSYFSDNYAGVTGGAIYLQHELQNDTSSIILEHSVFEGNSSVEGGVFSYYDFFAPNYSILFSNNLIIGNESGYGGALFLAFSTVESNISIDKCSFLYNSANGEVGSIGGGGAIWGAFKEASNCIFAGNSATYGACVYVHWTEQTPININFNNCTFYSNTAEESGGVFSSYVNSSPNAVYFNNSIFLDNTAENGNNIGVAYTEVYLNNCLTESDSCLEGIYIYSWGTAPVECNNMIYNADPLFKDTANLDFSLLPCSPAIDAGDNVYVSSLTDIAGNDRIINGTVDIGAYEAPATFLSIDNLTDAACHGENSGSVGFSYNGQAPFSTQWDNGIIIGSGTDSLAAGNYSLTITDANDCSEVIEFEIEEADSMAATFVTQEVSCYNGNDGSAIVTVQGGVPDYFISWSNGTMNNAASLLTGGWHQVTVVDANNCELIDSVFIEEPAAIFAYGDITNASTNNTSDGAIEIFNIIGGTAPFNLEWNTGDTTALIENLVPGVYVITITDANGCITTQGFLVSFNTGIELVEVPEIIVSPNPVERGSGLKIAVENISFPLKIDLYNSLGRLIQTEVLITSLNEFHIKTPENAGVYFLSIRQEDNFKLIEKIVVY